MKVGCFFLSWLTALPAVQASSSLRYQDKRHQKKARNLLSEYHFACPSRPNGRLCVTKKEDCDADGCVCKLGYERDPSCADEDHKRVYCPCIDQNECIQDSPPCPELGSFCVDYDPPKRYKCGCLHEFIPVLPSYTVDPVPRQWRPIACALSAVDTVTFADVKNGTTIDTSSKGTATGSFILRGLSPPGTTEILFQVVSDDAADGAEEFVEGEHAVIFNEDAYGTTWEIEVNALRSGTATFVAVALGPFGSRTALLNLNLVIPGPDEALIQPAFAFTPQFYDRLLLYNATTGTFVFSSDIASTLRVGCGLASGPIEGLAPNGYLRIVTSVEYVSSAGTTVVLTRQAGLAELIRRISLSYRSQAATSTSFELGGVRQRRSLFQVGPNTKLSVNLNFDPSASIDIDIGWDKGDSWFNIPFPVLERFFFEIGFEFKGMVSLEHTFEQLISIPDTSFGPNIEGTFGRIVIPTPFVVPIVIFLEFESGLKYSLQVKTRCAIAYKPKLGFKAGFEYLMALGAVHTQKTHPPHQILI